MESALAAVAGGLGVIVLGLIGIASRRNGANGTNGAIKRIDARTEEMVQLLRLIADREERGREHG